MKRGLAIATYNRGNQLGEIIQACLDTKPNGCTLVVCDDGSDDSTFEVVSQFKKHVSYYAGVNKGVGANKNRALFALKGCDTLCIIEDDLKPVESGWYEIYEKAAFNLNVHHFCRIQDKEIPETVPEFTNYCKTKLNLTPMFATSPRGDLSFFTSRVLREVGAFHPKFKGVGFAHGNHSDRCRRAGLCGHPLSWIDIKEANEKFVQQGDTEGGRWQVDPLVIRQQIEQNKKVRDQISNGPIFIPLELP